MKISTACIVTMSFIVAGSMLAGSPADVQTPIGLLVNEPLDGFGYSMRNPEVGEIWELKSASMRILQVVDDGVLVEKNTFSAPFPKFFFVKTSRMYADGDMLKTGYYMSKGIRSYYDITGVRRTVYAFSDLSPSEQQVIDEFRRKKVAEQERIERERIIRERIERERIERERIERERIERERIERERKRGEQAKLAEIAKYRLSAIGINTFARNLVIDKSVQAQMMDSQAMRILTELAEAQRNEDWLRMLSISRVILTKSQKTNLQDIRQLRMAEYPPIEELNTLINRIENLTLSSDMFPMSKVVLICAIQKGDVSFLEEMSENHCSRVVVYSGQNAMFTFMWQSEFLTMELGIKADGECRMKMNEKKLEFKGVFDAVKEEKTYQYDVEIAKAPYLVYAKTGLIEPVRKEVSEIFVSLQNGHAGKDKESHVVFDKETQAARKAHMVTVRQKLARMTLELIAEAEKLSLSSR